MVSSISISSDTTVWFGLELLGKWTSLREGRGIQNEVFPIRVRPFAKVMVLNRTLKILDLIIEEFLNGFVFVTNIATVGPRLLIPMGKN